MLYLIKKMEKKTSHIIRNNKSGTITEYDRTSCGSKYTSNINIRCSKEELELFKEACYKQGLKPSKQIRKIMQDYYKKVL